MSTNIEDRLVAALAARAETVQPHDLRAEPPPTSRRPVHQRPSTWLLAAAACLAVVAVPLAVMAGQGEDGSLPPAPTTQLPDYSQLPDTPQGPGADWPQVGKDDRRFDVDGDGVQDVVRLRNSTGKGSADVPWRVEVELAAGGVAGVVLDDVGYGVSLPGPTDVDGNGDDEVLYSAGVDGDWGVLDLTPNGLVDLRVKEPGLSNVPDAEGHLRSTWSEDGLFTTVSLEAGYFPGDDSARIPSTYPVAFIRWHLVGHTLSPEARGGQCVSNMNPSLPFACDEDSVLALPSFLPEVTDSAPVGKTVTTSFGQSLVELEMVGDRGEVAADGDVELRVTVDGQPYAAPVPAGGEPRVYATLLGGGSPAVVVRQGEDDPSYTVFRVQGGDLVALGPTGDPAASLDAGETWISSGAQLFTRESLGDDAYRVWTWTPTADGLVAEPSDAEGENRVCFDFGSDPVTWELC